MSRSIRNRIERLEKLLPDDGPGAWEVLEGLCSPDELRGVQAELWAEWMKACEGNLCSGPCVPRDSILTGVPARLDQSVLEELGFGVDFLNWALLEQIAPESVPDWAPTRSALGRTVPD